MSEKEKILITDDDDEIVWVIGKVLEKAGFDYETANNGKMALDMLEKDEYSLIILDIEMPELNGVEVMKKMKDKNIDIPVIILSAYEKVSYAVETTRLGAYDYIVKPISEDKLLLTIKNALKTTNLEKEVKNLKKQLEEKEIEIIGADKKFLEVVDTAKKIAQYDVSILILGESGTGKELLAHLIHKNSLRKNGPFISIDCATLPENLVESELFGHEKGAFTGAIEAKTGRFELANKGTLFLDEIGNLPLSVQKKLLRVLQERKIVRLGGKKEIKLDIRIIAATNVNLNEAVKKGEFREDLFHRLNEFYIEIPPLRKRGDDIFLLTNHFINKYNKKFNKFIKGISDDVKEIFSSYSWSGNVRELENVIKHSIILCENDKMKKENLPKSLLDRFNNEMNNMKDDDDFEKKILNEEFSNKNLKEVYDKYKSEVEKSIILKALNKHKWNKKKVAEELQIDYKTLYNKMKKYNL